METQEFIEFLKSIDLKEFNYQPEMLFFNTPSEWYHSGELKYNFKDYVIVIPFSLEYDLEEKLFGDYDLTITLFDLETLHIEKGYDMYEAEDFGVNSDDAMEYINNPYDTSVETEVYKADVVLDIPAKSKARAKAILKNVVELLNEKAKDVSWVYSGEVETKAEIYKRLVG